ncbi:MAG: hypothetical protein Q9208_000625 [Pyrenodesmia sp. 3 TL-2023]
MAFERELTRLANHLQSPEGANTTREDVHAALKDFAPKTRAQATAVQKFLAEAGMIEETKETEPEAAATSTSLRLNLRAKESDSESDDDMFERVPPAKNPWVNVTEEESEKAWSLWEVEQEKLVAKLKSPQYQLGGPKLKYPNLLKDLMSRLDFEDDEDSPRTYEPEMKHWREFGMLLAVLQEFGKGRDEGYVKIKLPLAALLAPPAIQGLSEEVPLTSHRTRLKPLGKNQPFDVDGIYCVELSLNSFESDALSWRTVLVDIDREALLEQGELPSRREWPQEEMLAEKATPILRAALNLRDPALPLLKGNLLAPHLPTTHFYLSAHPGATRPLRISSLGAYTIHYLHRGGPVTWTIIDPTSHGRIAALIHSATHTHHIPFSSSSTIPSPISPSSTKSSTTRPALPPQCTASVNHHPVYLSHDKLDDWEVGWTSFEQFAGECVVTGPFVWAQYYWNGGGVMEESVFGDDKAWKEGIAEGPSVKQCEACM